MHVFDTHVAVPVRKTVEYRRNPFAPELKQSRTVSVASSLMRRALERCPRDAFKTLLPDSGQITQFLARHVGMWGQMHPLVRCFPSNLRLFHELWRVGVSWPQRSFSSDAERSCILEHPKTGRQIHLLGCVHGSEESASEIRAKILDISPSSVVLPLCDFRYYSINNGTPVFPDELYVRLPHVLLLSPPSGIGHSTGTAPGI